jgi:two-component system sensor histidine kinase SenX3
MVELDGPVVVGALAALSAAGIAGLVRWWWHRRAMARWLSDLATRVDGAPPADGEDRSPGPAMQRLERTLDQMLMQERDSSVAEARLGRALDAMPQGVVIGDQRGRVVHRNAAAASIGGARHSRTLVRHAVTDLLAVGVAGSETSRTLDLFGPPRRTLVLSARPLEDGKGTVGGLVVIDDVSERRRLEAVRRDFVANISHELKTPIGALALLAETLAAEDDQAVAHRLADRVCAESHRIGRIIDDLLELTRIEVEEAPPREPVPIHLAVAQAVERVRPAADRRDVTIDVSDAPPSLTVHGDRRQLVSALANLLDNAVKYSDDGSTIAVRARAVAGLAEIEVADNGIGIPARDLERVFERFYRVDPARSRDTGGTGLGLAIVRHVASNHHGDVRVESREGQGSTFTLVLPTGSEQAATAPVAEAEAG